MLLAVVATEPEQEPVRVQRESQYGACEPAKYGTSSSPSAPGATRVAAASSRSTSSSPSASRSASSAAIFSRNQLTV